MKIILNDRYLYLFHIFEISSLRGSYKLQNSLKVEWTMDETVKNLLLIHKDNKILSMANKDIQPGLDWSSADLAGWRLDDLKLSDPDHPANFEAVNLENASLVKVDLRSANLSRANLKHADLNGANLVRANLRNVNAKGANFHKAYLREANFTDARLLNTDFMDANMNEANLQKTQMRFAKLTNARLEKAKFQEANLRHVDLEHAYAKDADFANADLKDSTLEFGHFRDCDFRSAYMKRANLKRTFLGGANFRDGNLTNATMKYAEFDSKSNMLNTNLLQCKLDYSTLKNCRHKLDRVVIQERTGNIVEAADVYLNLKNYFRAEGLYEISGDYYFREKLMERKLNYKSKKIFNKMLWLKSLTYSALCGYGEKPYRVILSSLIIILIFAFIYWGFGGLESGTNNGIKWYDNFYFSVVTFTTLGFGDIHPSDSIFIKFCTMLEAFTGAFMIALFVLTFGRRMLR
jgi:uncharacterized protein YjbI with pentapeptide repeats